MTKFTEYISTNQSKYDQATKLAGGIAEKQLADAFSLPDTEDPKCGTVV